MPRARRRYHAVRLGMWDAPSNRRVRPAQHGSTAEICAADLPALTQSEECGLGFAALARVAAYPKPDAAVLPLVADVGRTGSQREFDATAKGSRCANLTAGRSDLRRLARSAPYLDARICGQYQDARLW